MQGVRASQGKAEFSKRLQKFMVVFGAILLIIWIFVSLIFPFSEALNISTALIVVYGAMSFMVHGNSPQMMPFIRIAESIYDFFEKIFNDLIGGMGKGMGPKGGRLGDQI